MTTARRPWRVALSHAVYAVLVHLACLLALFPWLVRLWRDRRQWGWILQRFGRLPPGLPGRPPIWVHAVSVGEVKAGRPLVRALQALEGGPAVVLSTGTVTGRETARRLFPDVYVFPLPLDLPWVVSRVVRRVAPRLMILMELEVWPALMRAADRAGVPQVILNGRVSESSYRTYKRLCWWLPEFDRFALVAAQDKVHGDRITSLGVPPERVFVTGNLKHDVVDEADPVQVQTLGRELGLDGGPPVFVAGSTHDGEDGPVVRAWLVAGGGQRSQLVLVPRHLERLKEIGRLLSRLQVDWVLRSGADRSRPAGTVLLVDTMGELESLFALADVVFLGGSLVPVGGHNVLEPAAAGRPVLVGPYLETCRREAEALERAGGLAIVADEAALGERVRALLDDATARQAMGRRALEALSDLRGATRADIALLAERGLLGVEALHGPSESATLRRSPSPRTSRTGAPYP